MTARVAYAALGAMYARLDKSAVADGPGAVVEKFNAAVSKFAVAELDGVGVAAVAAAEANRAFAAWKDRNETRAEAMEVDNDGFGFSFSRAPFDPRPKRVDARRVVETRRAAFAAFAGLLVRTQTKAKFFEKLLEGGAKRWNALVHADETPRLEVETRLIRRGFAPRRGDGVSDGGSGASGARAADPSLAFTLSATLSAGDATLVAAPPPPPTTNATTDAGVRSSAEASCPPAVEGGDALGEESSLDELENHPLALGVYGALELASRGRRRRRLARRRREIKRDIESARASSDDTPREPRDGRRGGAHVAPVGGESRVTIAPRGIRRGGGGGGGEGGGEDVARTRTRTRRRGRGGEVSGGGGDGETRTRPGGWQLPRPHVLAG